MAHQKEFRHERKAIIQNRRGLAFCTYTYRSRFSKGRRDGMSRTRMCPKVGTPTSSSGSCLRVPVVRQLTGITSELFRLFQQKNQNSIGLISIRKKRKSRTTLVTLLLHCTFCVNRRINNSLCQKQKKASDGREGEEPGPSTAFPPTSAFTPAKSQGT